MANLPVTNDGIKSMLLSSTRNNNNTKEDEDDDDPCCCRPIIVQVLEITEPTFDSSDTDTNNESNKYVLRLSDTVFTVDAIVNDDAFFEKTDPLIQHIKDIPINSYICIMDYKPSFKGEYKHCILLVSSFRFHSYYYDNPVVVGLTSSKSISPTDINQCDDLNIQVLRWVQYIKDNVVDNGKTVVPDFKGKNIGYNEIRLIADAIGDNTVMETLKLRNNCIGNTGIQYLVDVLKENYTITKLDVSKNKITYMGIKAVVELLQYNTSLFEINLSYNTIGIRGAKILASVLEKNTDTVLSSIDFSYCKIPTVGIVALANMFKVNRIMNFVVLRGNSITDEGACAIATALQYNPKLERLNLSQNKIGNVGLSALAKALRYNSGLKRLLISDNLYNEEGIQAMYHAMEYNKKLKRLVVGRMDNDKYFHMFDEERDIQYEYDIAIKRLMDYNDTLEQIRNYDLPYEVRQIASLSNERYMETYWQRHVLSPDYLIPPKNKGQHQKHDILSWLLQNQHEWPISITQEPIGGKDKQEQQYQSKRLRTKSDVTNNIKKIRNL